MKRARTLLLVAATGVALGCERGVELARELDLDSTVVTVQFAAPIAVAPGPRAVCFEFARPSDSRHANHLVVALRDTSGVLDTLRGTVDRTGESAVCVRDSMSLQRSYASAHFASPRHIRVRRVTWQAPKLPRRAS